MPVMQKFSHLKYAAFALLLWLSACAIPQQSIDYYQTSDSPADLETGAIAQLHRQALTSIEKYDYQQAIEYLQRAIRIEPRNAWSWHYLAQAYWRGGNLQRCLDMLQRSQSYAAEDGQLVRANEALLIRCEA